MSNRPIISAKRIRELDQSVELITVSVDTPFAQGRFAKEAKIDNVTFLSDCRGGETLGKHMVYFWKGLMSLLVL